MSVESPQQQAPDRPGDAANHAADGLNTTHASEPKRRPVDAGVQAEVIDRNADRAALAMLGQGMRIHLFTRGDRARRDRQAARIGWFIVVGCTAAAVHWAIVVALVSHGGWHPLVANVAGWLVAFTVSFVGHHRLTFTGHGAPVWPAALRFFGVSALGFTINETAYALLLRWSGQHYGLVLAVVLLMVAVLTYLLSRYWAFLRSQAS